MPDQRMTTHHLTSKFVRSNLLGRIISGTGFPKGSIQLGLSVSYRKLVWERKRFPLKEARELVAEQHYWRF